MVEALSIVIDRRPKGRPHKMESLTIEKIRCVSILLTITNVLTGRHKENDFIIKSSAEIEKNVKL